MTPFPWNQAMRLGFGQLRLSSRDFWQMTPRELAAAIAGLGGTITATLPISRPRFDELTKLFPDQEALNG